MSLTKLSRFSALAILGITAATVPANATLMVNIGGSVVGGVLVGGTTYFDNQAGVDANPAVGVLDLGAFLNAVAVDVVVNGFASTSGSPIASLANTANITFPKGIGVPLTVDIFLSDTGFTSPATPLSLNQTVNILSSVNGISGNATATGWYGDTNTEFDVDGTSTSDAHSSLFKGISTNIPGSSSTITGPTPYSLTTHIHLNITALGLDPIQNLQLNANLAASPDRTQVPEPTSALLLGGSLLGLGAMLRMRKSS